MAKVFYYSWWKFKAWLCLWNQLSWKLSKGERTWAFSAKHIYDGKHTSNSKILTLPTNCINHERLLWSTSNFAEQFYVGSRSVILKILSQKWTLEVEREWEGRIRSKSNIPKTLNYWLTVMTFQHPGILEFLNALRSISYYGYYVRILWWTPQNITVPGYRTPLQHCHQNCCISDYLIFRDIQILYCPQKEIILSILSAWLRKMIKRNKKENHTIMWPRLQTKCLRYHLTGREERCSKHLIYGSEVNQTDKLTNISSMTLASEF